MAYDLEEQEKLDAIKAWWARYGTVVICWWPPWPGLGRLVELEGL